MKSVPFLLLVSSFSVWAQPVRPNASAAASSRTAAPAQSQTGGSDCVQVPQLAPSIPALPVGSPCPRALYTLSTVPSVKLDYVSPIEGRELAETLGIDSSTFTLAYVDTKPGDGPAAEPHKWYTIQYTGYLTDGTKFDSSLDRNEPIVLHIGEHQVIPGWDTGFAGMHVGGRRRLFIPYQLAYGSSGRPPAIPAKAELIFDVELVAQSDTEPASPASPDSAAPAAPGSAPPSQSK